MTWLYKFNEEEQEEDYEGGLEIEVEFEDVKAYSEVLDMCSDIFLERRKEYGNSLENARRFPHEYKSGLYLKCVRTVRDIENGKKLNRDTLIDLINYSIFLLAQDIEEGRDE